MACGEYAITKAIKSAGIELNQSEVERLAKEVSNEAMINCIYTVKTMSRLLDRIDVRYKILRFNSVDSLTSIFNTYLNRGNIVMAYYALQGFAVVSNKPNMKHGHWASIFKFEGSKVYGVQSNKKADMLGSLNGLDIGLLYKSNMCLNKIKVDWGKYSGCDINISRKQLGIHPRCGESECKLTMSASNNCIYNPDVSGVAFLIYK